MDKHPDESAPANRGPYFSREGGECPLCGMKLMPVGELEWAKAMLEAGGGEVAYTCPKHQHVYSDSPDACPVCGEKLEPFRAMYTCRDSKHSAQTSSHRIDCPRCGEPMVVFRGHWLGEAMVKLNLRVETSSGASALAVASESGREFPSNAQFVCPMQECWQFSSDEGRCPTCGMKLKPLKEVEWAARLASPATSQDRFVCPMHPDRARSDAPGHCPVCAMELIPRERIVGMDERGASVAVQIDYLMEHYLALQERFARDTTADAAQHALGLVEASEQLRDLLQARGDADKKGLLESVNALHRAALKIRGIDLSSDRAQFAPLSTAMRTLIARQRPDRQRWPKLFIYHCPMAQANWIQPVEKKANPYYGFKMLDCGNLIGTE